MLTKEQMKRVEKLAKEYEDFHTGEGYWHFVEGCKAYASDEAKYIKLLVDALEFYANKDNFCLYEDLSQKDWKTNWIGERHTGRLCNIGAKAKQALVEYNKTK